MSIISCKLQVFSAFSVAARQPTRSHYAGLRSTAASLKHMLDDDNRRHHRVWGMPTGNSHRWRGYVADQIAATAAGLKKGIQR